MMARRQYWLAAGLLGLCGLAFALRVPGLEFQSLWRDEVDAVRFASRSLAELAGMFATPGQNGPLFYLILRPWLELGGRSEFSLRFFSAALGTLTIPLVYRLGRRLFPSLPWIAFLGALLAATSPYLVWYGQEGKMYALVVVLVLLAMECYLAALEGGGWQRWSLYVLFASAAFYTHLLAALMVPVQGIVFALMGAEVRRARWKPWLASMAALTLPYLPLLVWQLPLLGQPASTGYAFVPFHEMLFGLATNYSLGVLPGAPLWSAALFVGLVLAAGWLWKGQRARWVSLGILTCWLLVPVLGLFLITLVRPLYTARYLIFVLPAYLLLVAAGVVAVARRSRFLAGLWLAVLLVANGWGLWLQARTPLKADFRGATEYLVQNMAANDVLLFQIPYGRYSFEYYYRAVGGAPAAGGVPPAAARPEAEQQVFLPLVLRASGEPYRWAEGPYTNAGMSPEEVDRRMAELLAGNDVVWLVATEVPLWDERGLVQAWLDGHARLTDEADFVRVEVRRYELP